MVYISNAHNPCLSYLFSYIKETLKTILIKIITIANMYDSNFNSTINAIIGIINNKTYKSLMNITNYMALNVL